MISHYIVSWDMILGRGRGRKEEGRGERTEGREQGRGKMGREKIKYVGKREECRDKGNLLFEGLAWKWESEGEGGGRQKGVRGEV